MEETTKLEELTALTENDLRSYAPGTKDRNEARKQLIDLQKIEVEKYRVEAEAYDRDRRMELDRELDQAKLREDKKKRIFDVLGWVVKGGITVFIALRMLKVDEDSVVDNKKLNQIPKPRIW